MDENIQVVKKKGIENEKETRQPDSYADKDIPKPDEHL
jgi:hypothetical protein